MGRIGKHTVCFTNASGGKILIGIEEDEPVADQIIADKTLPEKIVKANNYRTIKTGAAANIITAVRH